MGTITPQLFLRHKQGRQIEYVSVFDLPHAHLELKQGIDGQESGLFNNTLVRRGKPDNFRYYPLPLIFASPEERTIAAETTGRARPSERWVRHIRTQILEYLK